MSAPRNETHLPDADGSPRTPHDAGDGSPRNPHDAGDGSPRNPHHAGDATDYGLPEHPACPFCENENTELHSAFGPQLSVATYWCRDCRAPFDFVKWKAG